MRRVLSSLIVIAAILALAMPVLAGGWATVRLDESPGDLHPGQPWQFGFMVLQHDVTPNSDVTPVVRAVHLETGDTVTATAVQEGQLGHFVAELTLPRSGAWSWTITPEPFAETSFPALVVGDQQAGDASLSPASHMAGTCASPGAMTLCLFAPDRPGNDAAPPGPTEVVAMSQDWLFQPASLEITSGSTVTWINRSSIVHAVTLDDPAHTASGLIEPGQSFSVTFDTSGVFTYRCSPHPGMEGTISVVG